MAVCIHAFLRVLTAETHLPLCQLTRHQFYASNDNRSHFQCNEVLHPT